MARYLVIFSSIAIFFVSVALVLGLSLGDVQKSLGELQEVRAEIRARQDGRIDAAASSLSELTARAQRLAAAESWTSAHRLAGVAASLVVVLVYSVCITYFIGTGKWCREVVETYELDPRLVDECNRNKRKAFPWSMIGILWAIGMVALGAAADPSTGRSDTADWVTPHLLAALLGMVWLVWSFWAIHGHLVEQHRVISEVLEHVGKRRAANSLASH